MQNLNKIDPVKHPLEDQASHSKEPSTKLFAHISISFIGDDV
jgi:hypothetical protein